MSESSPITQTIGFVLVPNFALMSFSAATEPLRAANLLAGAPLYAIRPLSLHGEAVACSSGFAIPCGSLQEDGASCHTVFIVAGGNPADWQAAKALYPVLRRLSRQGVRLGGISSGSYLLAAAGLLDGRDFTIHWEHAPALIESFPHLQPRQARYVVDGDRITCGGGVAPLDMMHDLIGTRLGTAFARRVSDWFLHTGVASSTDPQRASVQARHGTRHPALIAVLEKMEATIERPLPRNTMARLAGVSERHLDRLFRTQLDSGFAQKYRQIRLEHARRLLEQSPLSISEIAFASGFSSSAHFCRGFSLHYGMTPTMARKAGG